GGSYLDPIPGPWRDERHPEPLGSELGRRYQARDGICVADRDRPLSELDPTRLVPALKNFVDAFPAATRVRAELSLRDMKFDRRTRNRVQGSAIGEVQQRLCNPRFQMTKQYVLDLLTGLTQPLTQNLQQNQANIRALLEDRHEIAAVQHQELAVRHSNCVSRSL